MNKIILASKSPRRKELLSMLGIKFDVIVSDIDEKIDYQNNLVEEIKKLSYQKAYAVFVTHQDDIVIGSDTIVYIDNEVLGKPKSIEEAKHMLHKLSNRTHQVVTAVTIISKDKVDSFASITDVTFYELTDQEINEYVDTVEPLDKAGAYAIQGKGSEFVKSINGDFYTVVGLPIAEVYRHLKAFTNADIV